MKPVPLSDLTVTHFAPLLSSRFQVSTAGAAQVEMQLVEVTPLAPGGSVAGSEFSFSLVFAGPPAPFLSQAIYRFEHEKLGSFDLFIAPIGGDSHGGFRYEAVFNRAGQRGP